MDQPEAKKAKMQNLKDLIKSFKSRPGRQQDSNFVTLSPSNEQEEIQLIDLFIKEHADKYQLLTQNFEELPGEEDVPQDQSEADGVYVDLAQALILNRVNVRSPEEMEAAAGGGSNPQQPLSQDASKQGHAHQLRIYQCLRILCRDEVLCQSILQPKLQTIQKLVAKLIELAQVCINGSNHLQSNFNQTSYQLQNTGKFSSPGRLTQTGMGPGGSGPIQNDEEIVCDILTEIISTLFKMFTRLHAKQEKIKAQTSVDQEEREILQAKQDLTETAALMDLFYENVEFLQNIQLLLGVKFHNVLLRIVFELILCLVEAKPPLVEHFRNLFTIDILLKIFEDYQDTELKLSAIETLSQLCKGDQLMGSFEILFLFRKLYGPSKLINYIQICEKQTLLMSIIICLSVITADDQDLLIELKELNIAQVMLDLLQRNVKNPIMICQILSILTNVSLNDQINVNIRQQGAHLIGKIMMDNCPPLIKERAARRAKELEAGPGGNSNEPAEAQNASKDQITQEASQQQYSENQIEDIKVKHEIQLHCLRTLRFLFSIEKNRKSFKLVFPPEIFGNFIDVGNFNRNFQSYVPLLKKINKRLPIKSLEQIQQNFEQMGQFMNSHSNKKKFIGGFQVIDLIGKGAYGSVYLVQKGDVQYAMKELPIAHFDISPDQLQKMQKELDVLAQSTDELLVEEICKEVSILKELDHPNITRYYTSFPNGQNIYIVMELLDGVSLADFILSQSEKKHRVKEEVIWNILTQLCGALKYLHDIKRIVHRDLAPSNILIDSDFNIKLADFGLAKRFGTQSMSVMKSFVGTILYSCPEIVQSQSYTNKADIWSLGCIIYELMTLQQPFSGNNPLSIAKKIVDGEYEEISEEDGYYSPMLIQIVRRCMDADQNTRPNITELCQMMVDIVMQQLDFLRIKDQANTQEIRHLKDKLKYYEGPTSTGFKGFSSAEAAAQQHMGMTTNTQNNKL